MKYKLSVVPRFFDINDCFTDPWRSSFSDYCNDNFRLSNNHNMLYDFPYTTFREVEQQIRNHHQFIRDEFRAHPLLNMEKFAFEICVDVHQFKPNEISVKVVENIVVVEVAKHEERRDQQGFISRQFSRRFILPSGYDVNKVQSIITSEGYLTVKAPPPPPRYQSVERILTIHKLEK